MLRTFCAALAASFLLIQAGPAAAQAQVKRDWLGLRSPAGLPTSRARLDLDQPALRRYAVVIGNDTYAHAPKLGNAVADAKAMSALLRRQGFQVEERINLDKRGFEDLLRKVLFEVGPETEVVFFFAGHGIQIGRRNYLLPVDSRLSGAFDTPFETITLDSLVRIFSARSRRQLFILDSCRNNPFDTARMMTEIDSTLFETNDGFSAMSAPVNSLVAYSTSPGAVAFDGEDGNSPFTGAFVRLAEADPGLSMRELLSLVRRDVYRQTSGQQVPWESSTLIEPFIFKPSGVALAAATPGRPGETRGFRTVAASVGPADATRQVTIGADITVSAPLDRRVALGEALVGALSLGPAETVSLRAQAGTGRLVIEGDVISDYPGGPITADALGKIIYEYAPGQNPAGDDIEALAVTEDFVLTRGTGPGKVIRLNLRPNTCDFQAGDWLDPEGVGITRYPNEIDPAVAEAECRAAVERMPKTGRFHYQLGRALQAGRKFDEARAAFERASKLGHTRAWHALGDLVAEGASIEGGQSNTAVSAEALELYAKGVERGDPYAFHALGKQLLRHGKTETARRYGFDLLGRALELGHTFAMNELGYYFLDEKSDHFEADRGLRYLRESAGRKDIYGYNNLGLVYDRGLGGVEVDAAKALEWYTLAADGGHPYAPVNIGRMYVNGKFGGRPDYLRAIEWYDKGLAGGIAWGGANSAWVIANKRPRGYSPGDAAVRAAKAAVLRDAGAASQAMAVINSLNARALDAGSQIIIRDFIPDQVVDGLIGPKTKDAIAQLARKHRFEPPPDDPKARLLALARIYWRVTGVRIDLL